MTRSELIAKLAAKNPTLYHRDIERLVATILDEVSAALERGSRVELRGFGAFSVRERKARLGRNQEPAPACKFLKRKYLFLKWEKGCVSS